jgi:hypothetical protein
MQNEEPSATIVDQAAMARAVAVVTERQYRRGEAFLARYSARYQPLYPDIEDLERLGVDIMALATALEKNNLDAALFGEVIVNRRWEVEDTNRYLRAGISCANINSAMKHFLDNPNHW